MGLFKKNIRSKEVPGLNTASLPDLIFTVLFFFMIVTQMRHDEIKVRLTEPEGTNLAKLQQKKNATFIYIGKDITQSDEGNYIIQIDNNIVPQSMVYSYMKKKTSGMAKEDVKKMVINIKADKDIPMNIIKDVKESLKKANTLLVHYSANEKD